MGRCNTADPALFIFARSRGAGKSVNEAPGRRMLFRHGKTIRFPSPPYMEGHVSRLAPFVLPATNDITFVIDDTPESSAAAAVDSLRFLPPEQKFPPANQMSDIDPAILRALYHGHPLTPMQQADLDQAKRNVDPESKQIYGFMAAVRASVPAVKPHHTPTDCCDSYDRRGTNCTCMCHWGHAPTNSLHSGRGCAHPWNFAPVD